MVDLLITLVLLWPHSREVPLRTLGAILGYRPYTAILGATLAEGALRGESGVSLGPSVSATGTDILIWDHDPASSGPRRAWPHNCHPRSCRFALFLFWDLRLQADGV